MNKLKALIAELELKIPYLEKLNESVSSASVGWHIQHSVQAALQIIQAIERSKHENYKWKFNLPRLFVFSLNKIPRGKGKAPASVMPEKAMSADEMKDNFQLLKSRIRVLEKLHRHNYFTHQVFGDLNLNATIKMLQIHTKHHIGIINDIIKS